MKEGKGKGVNVGAVKEGAGKAGCWPLGGREELWPGSRACEGAACRWQKEQVAGRQEGGRSCNLIVGLVKELLACGLKK